MSSEESAQTAFLSSGQEIKIRPPKASDVDQMLEFINDLSLEDIYLNANPAKIFSKQEEENYLNECLHKIKAFNQIYLLAFQEDVLVGSVTVTRLQMRQAHVGLFGLTVAKKWRGKGIGKILATKALDSAKKIQIELIVLDVFAQNLPAINLYKSLGFIQYGLLPAGFLYKDKKEDKVLMYKNL